LIPASYIQAWSAKAPWPDARQIEQDLIICRALCDLFNAPALKGKIAFRGGTAINKLLFKQPLRYSEDIDLVQTEAAPIGATVDAIREALSWLGKCRRDQAQHSMHLEFKFVPEADAQTTLKLKVEINTREQSSLFGIKSYRFAVDNDWYQGKTEIASYEPEELFGTKLRALLQRRKNRDLFDLYHGLEQLALDPDKLIACSIITSRWRVGPSRERRRSNACWKSSRTV
jgi:predicted nucleotidyltransferase component of viral defense system